MYRKTEVDHSKVTFSINKYLWDNNGNGLDLKAKAKKKHATGERRAV